jgi:hypothetical protein
MRKFSFYDFSEGEDVLVTGIFKRTSGQGDSIRTDVCRVLTSTWNYFDTGREVIPLAFIKDLEDENAALKSENARLLREINLSKNEGESFAMSVVQNADLSLFEKDDTYKVKFRPFQIEQTFPARVKSMSKIARMAFLDAASAQFARRIAAMLETEIFENSQAKERG